ncbi:FAD-dependent oxidoreductase [Planctomicrobium piriforme]|uniref:FAD dependent oxidoreductase n=1 Tax=Planctomicrobium piriforme TaxID=1576369 RepID=A0A1I3G2J7_9PLAN|nr:FAD-dependent oxidoreductase [Planctomicrobium piriforme]SFI17637.1 FAD dependent oxidoreductase [Planctomicrobium piriforme]
MRSCFSAIFILFCMTLLLPGTALAQTADVVVYGATPGGIAAAVAAAKDGNSVLLIEPTDRIGGLVTSGLSHTDFHSFESLTGSFLDFSRRVLAYYEQTYGKDSPLTIASFRGTFGEPKVNLTIFEQMLAEQHVSVLKNCRLKSAELSNERELKKIKNLVCRQKNGDEITVSGKMFIDGTYEGDLMAAAGVPWKVGREGRDEYGESLAPEQPDGQLQAYNFRLIATQDPALRVMPVAPPGYRREDFVDILPVLASGKIKKVFDYPLGCIYKAQTPALPNGKYDLNDVSRGDVRLSLPGKNLEWPNGDEQTRQKIFAEHLRDQVGLLYFLQNDPAVPENFRNEAREWGWCRDEFVENGHLSPQLYVREARRMVGAHVYKQSDSEPAPDDARATFHPTSIAMADYGNNCHGTFHEGPRFSGKHSGEFYYATPPYQIPYGVLISRDVSNLLVPVAVSSSHVGFCALRLEPVWMSLGQAAGHAASQAISKNLSVQQVDVPQLQCRLHADGSATIYVSDVLPADADFAVVQWWGTNGGLHGLNPAPKKVRGQKLHGQYSEAAPGHAAELNLPLDPSLAASWITLAEKLGIPIAQLPPADGKATRGDFLRAAAKLSIITCTGAEQ